MLSLLGWIFMVLFWGASACFAFFVFWTVLSLVMLFLNALRSPLETICGGFRYRKPSLPPKHVSTETVMLDDPIGVLSVISHRYNDPLSLKDLAYLEVQLFGSTSTEFADWYRLAEKDPRPEVCGTMAVKMLLKIARCRQSMIQFRSWDDNLENLWKKGTPKEFRLFVSERMAS